MLGIGAGYPPYEFERFGADIAQNLGMTELLGYLRPLGELEAKQLCF